MVEEILVLFDRAVSDDGSFAALRGALEKSKPVAQYLRLLAADQGRNDADAAAELSVSMTDLAGIQREALEALRAALAPRP